MIKFIFGGDKMNFDALEKYIDSLYSKGIVACDLAVSYKGKTVFRKSAGFSDIEKKTPVSNKDKYWIYSSTKPITAAASMQLIEKGKISIDDELCKYLPAYEKMSVFNGQEIVPAKNKIKIKDLLTMTAGFSYDLTAEAIVKAREKNPLASTREMIDALAKQPLLFEPSEKFNYSLCLDVMGAVIEVVSGMSLGEYYKKNIFEPLRMNNTGFAPNSKRPDNMSSQYWYIPEEQKSSVIECTNAFILSEGFESGGAGLYSTTDDYLKFVTAMSSPENPLLKKESVEFMSKDWLSESCKKDFDLINKKGYSYGFGVRTLVDKEASKSPIGEFGWDSAGGAFNLMDIKNELGIVYFQNIHNCTYAFDKIHYDIRDAVYTALNI